MVFIKYLKKKEKLLRTTLTYLLKIDISRLELAFC